MDLSNDVSKKIVVLIDADNAQIGKLREIMAEIATHGHIIVKKAYGDWSSVLLKNWKDELNFLAIQPIQQFAYTSGKNSSDILIVIDAMDLLYTGKYDTFVLVSSDSDFTSLATRLRSSEIFVYGIGEKKTPTAFRNACDDFIFTENLNILEKVNESTNENVAQEENISYEQNEKNQDSENVAQEESISYEQNGKNQDSENVVQEESMSYKQNEKSQDLENVIRLLYFASDTYEDEEGWANISSAGSYIKRSMPDFNPKNYGFSKLPELIGSLSNLFEMKKYKGKGTVNIIAYRRKE